MQVDELHLREFITLDNVKDISKDYSPVVRRRVVGSNTRIHYQLVLPLYFRLSDGTNVEIPEGFMWDLSSVPRPLWGLLPPDGDFEIPSLLHDYLYRFQPCSRKFADKEMLLWSKATSGTLNTISIRNFDNWVRYVAVRLFGWIVWNKKVKRDRALKVLNAEIEAVLNTKSN